MKVLILAAGRSKRMYPVTDKNFLNFLGKPLIQHQIEIVKSAGFKDIILVGGEHNLAALMALAVELSKKLKLNIEVIEQENLDLGMCGAVLAAKNSIKNSPVIVFSSNDVVEAEAFKQIEKMSSTLADSFILGKMVHQYFPGGYLKMDKSAYISEIIEKPEPGTEPSKMVNVVVHLHKKPEVLVKYLEKTKSKKDDLYEVALSKMMTDGIKMMAVEYDGFWQPVKYPWHIQNVFRFLMSKAKKSISKSAEIAKSAVINGQVIIGERVKIFDNAVINGPCYIGDDSVIATNSLVRDSNIGRGCIIGFSTEVARSFLSDEVWTHSNYIGDSVIGNNVSFGAGTVTGNLRLDEREVEISVDGKKLNAHTNKFGAMIGSHVRVGVNTSLMPGVRIGSGCFIGAGILVPEDIPENSFVRGTFELKISQNKTDVSAMRRDNLKKKL
ncbi:MAG: sugar phosphate nucleotidyltransferase [Patescibacteria group bacterium]